MLFIKSLHIIFIITWFCGLLYLPRLFIYHLINYKNDSIKKVFIIMEYRLFYYIMNISLVLSLLFGILLLLFKIDYLNFLWIKIKIILVFFLIIYHFYCIRIMKLLLNNNEKIKLIFLRFYNEVPFILLFIIVILVIMKPF